MDAIGRIMAAVLSLMGATCTYGPPEYRGQIDSVVLLADGQIALGYAQLVSRRAEGFAAFPDGGIAKVDHERLLVALVDRDGRTRIIHRFGNAYIPGSAQVHVSWHKLDPSHIYVTTTALESTQTQALAMRTMRMDLSGRIVSGFDLAAELIRRGRSFGAKGFGGHRVVDSDGTSLIGASRGSTREVWRRDPDGSWTLLGPIGEEVEVIGNEIIHYVDGEGLARNWRTGEQRRLSYYDRRLGRRVILNPADSANQPPRFEVEEGASASPADRIILITRGGSKVAEIRPDFSVLDQR